MPLFSVENHFHVALLSITIAPSTFLGCALLFFAYNYILHIRNNPVPTRPARRPIDHDSGNDRRVGKPVRRPSIFGRFSARLRTNKQRDRPFTPLWLPFTSFWLPFRRQRVGDGRVDVRRQIQPASVGQDFPFVWRKTKIRVLGSNCALQSSNTH